MPRIKGTASQEILYTLLVGGAFVLAAQSPYFWIKLYQRFFEGKSFKKNQVLDAFQYLKKKKRILVEKHNHQIYVRLTKEGEREAGRYQINKLRIPIPKSWDKKWRLIIFDIPEKLRIKREAFRGKLKELRFYPLQKSIWVYPHPCEKEIKLLREFFALTPHHLRILEVEKLEEDQFLRKFFELSGP